MKKILYANLFLALVVVSCQSEQGKGTMAEQTEPQKQIERPDFDADSAYSFVKTQVDFGPRVPNSASHKACADYLSKKLTSFADTVEIQSFTTTLYDGKKIKGYNIIGSFNPGHSKRVLLAAHWDSRPFADNDPDIANSRQPIDGANDGASGVGVLLEIARQLSLKAPNIGVDIIFFDVEDHGEPSDERDLYPGENWCLGSQYWSLNPHKMYYKANYGILLDMVGGKNARFFKEGTSRYYAAGILDRVWSVAQQLGFGSFFLDQDGAAITDDHLYVNANLTIPMIDIIELSPYTNTGFNPHWHTIKDNIDNIDKNSLSMVGQVVLAVLYQE